jgi:hypothetical protein
MGSAGGVDGSEPRQVRKEAALRISVYVPRFWSARDSAATVDEP